MTDQVTLTDLQKEILSNVQSNFPIVHRPYEEIGRRIGASEDDVYQAMIDLRDAKVIRRVGAIFDSYKLGYRSTLCAIAVPQERVEEVAALINEYPNVTHNYLRENRYNVWFTLIAPSEARIEAILGEIANQTGIDDILNLPAIRLFKIRVDFDFTGTRDGRATKQPIVKPADTVALTFDGTEKALVRLLQADLPAGLTPFETIATELAAHGFHVDERWVLQRTSYWIEQKAVRRFGAALKHHKTGFTYNAMGVWSVPDERIDEVGPIMASFKEVSHCYERPTYPTWPSNTYTMIHGTSKEACEDVAHRIQQETGVAEPFLLYSTREFKKVSMKYFMEDV